METTLAGWVADFISVCLETRWLGQKPWFLLPGTLLYSSNSSTLCVGVVLCVCEDSKQISLTWHVHADIYTYIYTNINWYTYQNKSTYVCTYIHTYAHTNVHAYIHTYTCTGGNIATASSRISLTSHRVCVCTNLKFVYTYTYANIYICIYICVYAQ